MFTKFLALTVCVSLVSLIGLLAPSAPPANSIPRYQPVADWPRLPPQSKFGDVVAVATDAADRVYVFHRGKQPIMVFDKSGKFLHSWGDDRIDTAHGLRVDGSGNVWITDIGTHLVTKFDSQGKVLLTLGKKDEPGEGRDQFNEPADVAIAPAGEIFVADGYGNSRVVKFTKDGKYIKEWGKKGTGEGEFDLPHTICLDGKGRVYVGDRENNRVQVFDGEGKFLAQWKECGAPYGLFFAGDRMLLADGRANAVKVLDLQGKIIGRWGEKGSAAGQFTLPHWVCVDSQGAVYVADSENQRVQKFVAK